MVHLILVFVFVIAAVKITEKSNKNGELLLSFAVLFLFAALRYEYGNDYESYRRIFINAKDGINSEAIEPLYYELNKIFPSFQLLIAMLSLLYLFAVYKLITKYVDKKYIGLSVLITVINPYLFLMSLSAIRQAFVVALFILSLVIIQEKTTKKLLKFIVFLCVTVLSCFIHSTAILLLPFYFVYYCKHNIKRDYLVFVTTPIILLLFPEILSWLINAVLQLLFKNSLSYWNYLTYLESNDTNSLRALLLFLIFYIYVLLNLKKLDEKIYPIAKLYLCGLEFAILAYRYSMFGRFQMYFDIFSVVTIPAIIKANLQARLSPVKKVLYVYIFPCAIFMVYLLRYYSFFTTELYSSFFEYRTVFCR